MLNMDNAPLFFMDEIVFFRGLAIAWIVLAVAGFLALLWMPAPYGRYARRSWGPLLDSRLGWVLMEGPSAVLFGLFFLLAPRPWTATEIVLLVMWEAHYIHRAFIYPFRRGGPGHPMPASVVAMGLGFHAINGYLNGRWVFGLSGGYPNTWLTDPRFLAGAAIFLVGFVINKHADAILRRLRSAGPGYSIPAGGLYRWVSCPNYLGEIIEWIGWAVATWSLAGLTFAVWTFANLAPRALAHHRWYRRQFPDYPAGRRALIPGIC